MNKYADDIVNGYSFTLFNEEPRLEVWLIKERKKPCLFMVNGNVHTKIASFNDIESASKFLQIMVDRKVDEDE